MSSQSPEKKASAPRTAFKPDTDDPRQRTQSKFVISDLSDLYRQDADASRLVREDNVNQRTRRPPEPATTTPNLSSISQQQPLAQPPPRVSSLEPRPSYPTQHRQPQYRSWRDPYAPSAEYGEGEGGMDSAMDLEKAFPATYGQTANAYASNGYNGKQPLLNRVTNEWMAQRHTRARRRSSSATSVSEGDDDCCSTYIEVCASRICRRYLLAVIVLICLISFLWVRLWGPEYGEKSRLKASVREAMVRDKGYWGINMQVSFPGLDVVRSLDDSKVPGRESQRSVDLSTWEDRRLIIIGDIHGCVDELKELLIQVNFNPDTDHIVATGDMIARGPSSVEVIDLLMEHNASCVRGNHEERTVLTWRDWKAPTHYKVDVEGVTAQQALSKGPKTDTELAASLSDKQAAWLRRCPLILDLGQIAGLGHTVVAHAGLVPLVPLEHQDPDSVQTMRGIDLRTHAPVKDLPPGTYVDRWAERKGKHYVTIPPLKQIDRYGRPWVVPWPKLWDVAQGLVSPPERKTVIYGHDETIGLTSTPWTMGLDGGCVRGGDLAALVLSVGKGERTRPKPTPAPPAKGMRAAMRLSFSRVKAMGGRVKGMALGVVGKGVHREVVKVSCRKYAEAALGEQPLGAS